MWPNPQFSDSEIRFPNLVTFTEETFDEKLLLITQCQWSRLGAFLKVKGTSS